jgi:blocked early in transport 1
MAAKQPMHQRKTNSNSSSNTPNNMVAKRNGGVGSYDPERGGSDTNANILEQQNNERINLLSEQVSRLKGLTIDIGNEVREQNSLLDTMGDGFSNTRDLLQGSLRRITHMLDRGGTKHMCYLVAFCVAVMVFLWWLMSYKGKTGA